jgi:hypothetical protein
MTLLGLDSRSSNAAHCCNRVWAPERRPFVSPSVHSRVCVCVGAVSRLQPAHARGPDT